jgi:LPXTG-motif cell wall-anchored protein
VPIHSNNTAAITLNPPAGGVGGGVPGSGGGLPVTGSNAGVIGGVGAVLLAVGFGLYLAVRRRRVVLVAGTGVHRTEPF